MKEDCGEGEGPYLSEVEPAASESEDGYGPPSQRYTADSLASSPASSSQLWVDLFTLFTRLVKIVFVASNLLVYSASDPHVERTRRPCRHRRSGRKPSCWCGELQPITGRRSSNVFKGEDADVTETII